jgi:hypothetical protein
MSGAPAAAAAAAGANNNAPQRQSIRGTLQETMFKLMVRRSFLFVFFCSLFFCSPFTNDENA